MKKIFFALIILFGSSICVTNAYCQTDTTSTGVVFSSDEVTPPQFPGGEQAMFSFIDSVLIIPESAIQSNESGRVIVRFFVNKEGEIKSPSIQQGLSDECNQAALAVVTKMPKWIPAQQNGKSVTGFASAPISFKTKVVTYEYQATEQELEYEQYVLPEKKWVMVEINGKALPENVANTPYFIMTIDKRKKRVVEGNLSCSDFSTRWNWNMKKWRLSFSKITVKKSKCKSKKVKVIDGDVESVLKKTKEYRITKEGKLQIGNEQKDRFVPLATFVAEPLKKGKKRK